MWRRLRARQISGVRFRRQAPIGPYIVDFASYRPRIVVELDGSQHAEPAHRLRDEARDLWLESQGFVVLRFWDNDVLTETESVLDAILQAIERCR